MKRELKVPAMIISIGKMNNDNQRLFAITDETTGKCVLPVFTDFEIAEQYRAYHTKNMAQHIIPISILGSNNGSVTDELVLYVIESQTQLRDILDTAFIVAQVVYVTINPTPGDIMLCYEYDELITT